MNIYIGTDVAKTFHVACAINSQGRVPTRLRFENDAAGFREFHQTIQSLSLQEGGQVLCGMESTGHYGVA